MQCLTETSTGIYVVTSPQPAQYTTCTAILATPTELLANPDVSYDYAAAGASFGFAFIAVFSLWFYSKNAGVILAFIRRL